MSMVLREFSIPTMLALALVASAVGYSAHIVTKKDDSPIEEKAEEFVEDKLVTIFNLPEGCLADTIDFTPESPEDK